jgi:calcium-dependent protein kinase
LFQRLETGVFTEEQARIIFFQALEAVAYCHGERVMHRDIKPENLMFLDSKTLNLKVIDFGLALRWQTDARA